MGEVEGHLAIMECRGCFYGVAVPESHYMTRPAMISKPAHVLCHLMPTMLEVKPDHWCGQFADAKAREYPKDQRHAG